MVQQIIIGLLFALALAFLVRMVYKAFTQKDNCSAGCSCSTISIQEIEMKMKSDERFKEQKDSLKS